MIVLPYLEQRTDISVHLRTDVVTCGLGRQQFEEYQIVLPYLKQRTDISVHLRTDVVTCGLGRQAGSNLKSTRLCYHTSSKEQIFLSICVQM
jgi:hypothetical protein